MHFKRLTDALRWQKQQKNKAKGAELKHKEAFWKKWAVPLFILIASGALLATNATAGWIFLSVSLLGIGVLYRKNN